MFKYTKNTLQKLEGLFKEQGYVVRYEKGSFTSGYCVVEDRKIAIINRFYDTEGRINTLLDILSNVAIDVSIFEEKTLKFYNLLMKKSQETEENEEVENEEENKA